MTVVIDVTSDETLTFGSVAEPSEKYHIRSYTVAD